MTRVQLLEREIRRLDPTSLKVFRKWFGHYDAAAWDRQIARDSKNGKLRKLAGEALSEHKAGKMRAL